MVLASSEKKKKCKKICMKNWCAEIPWFLLTNMPLNAAQCNDEEAFYQEFLRKGGQYRYN